MRVVSHAYARSALQSVIDGIVMSLDDDNRIMETLHPASAAALARAIAHDKADQASPQRFRYGDRNHPSLEV